MKKKKDKIILLIASILIVCLTDYKEQIQQLLLEEEVVISYSIEEIPKYDGKNHIIINNNEPEFLQEDKIEESFEIYNKQDKLNRTLQAYANVSIDTMPDEERGSIGSIKPTGWQTVKYDSIDGKYLYNRCHLIAYQLTGENANELNLITCTRQMNVDGMLEFENKVADYIKKTQNHVLYRVTPYYEGDNLLASGVQIEAYSVEDNGVGIKFNVYVYNVQDGIEIDYSTGESKLK